MPGGEVAPMSSAPVLCSPPRRAKRNPRGRRAGAGQQRQQHRRPEPCRRLHEPPLPIAGVPNPTRTGLDAVFDLSYAQLRVVWCYLAHLRRGKRIGTRDLARGTHIRPSSASQFLRGEWPSWAEAVVRSGNGIVAAYVEQPEDVMAIVRELRETPGNVGSEREVQLPKTLARHR